MFIGEYQHTVDAKGRMIVPVRFREAFNDRVVVNRGLDGCLNVYTLAMWETIYQKLLRLPTTRKDVRQYIRVMTAKASECEFDAAGRILLPKTLLDEAMIEKNVVVVGAADHVEIWSTSRWTPYYEEASSTIEDIAESLKDLEGLL